MSIPLKTVTPLLIVEQIEPCLSQWTGPLGYVCVDQVPHGDALGFVILKGAAGMVMLQTRASVRDDLPALHALGISAFLYVAVSSIEETISQLGTLRVIVPLRETFYGAREIGVIDAAGQVLLLAEHSAPSAS